MKSITVPKNVRNKRALSGVSTVKSTQLSQVSLKVNFEAFKLSVCVGSYVISERNGPLGF